MAILRIYGDPVLRKRSKEIKNIDGTIKDLAMDMIKSVKTFQGIGLAANQVGEDKRIFVVDRSRLDLTEKILVVINPQIIEVSGKQTEEEGCLSIPGTFEHVARPLKVTVKALDLDGKEFVVEGKNLFARVLNHEIDHLDGILFIDHLSNIRRKLLSKKLKKIAEKKGRIY
jgi:peptide deformylase